jgi:HEPN domain-containing protein
MSRNLDEATRWLSQARYDLRAAQVNEQSTIYAWACFLCQQAAEKALKAFLYAQGEGPVIGHSSLRLAQECAGFDRRFTHVLRACKTLDGYYIPTRYPNGLPGGIPYEVFDEFDAREALEAATAVVSLVESAGLLDFSGESVARQEASLGEETEDEGAEQTD